MELYSPAQWVARFGSEYNLTSIEHVRACCRQQIDKRTGRTSKLPDGWSSTKIGKQHFIVRTAAGARRTIRGNSKTLPKLREIKVHDQLIWLLRMYMYDACVSSQPVTAKVTLYPDGLFSCIPESSGSKTMPSLLPFAFCLQMHLIRAFGYAIDPWEMVQKKCDDFGAARAYAEFKQRCAWCGHKKPSTKTAKARFCGDEHHESFKKWIKATMDRYRREHRRNPFTPNPDAHSPWFPELLNHPVVGRALSERLRYIEAAFA